MTDFLPSECLTEDETRYAEGNREEWTCRCGASAWIVYHGPHRNHTLATPFAECCRQFQPDGSCCAMPPRDFHNQTTAGSPSG